MITRRNRNRIAAAVAVGCFGLALAQAAGAVDLRDWGRKVPVSERFVVLSQFGDQAVLDKETQLVWERTPSSSTTGTTNWRGAKVVCARLRLSGRWGWRLPSVHELSSLAQPGSLRSVLALPSGHPFINVPLGEYWTATQLSEELGPVFTFRFDNFGSVEVVNALSLTDKLNYWCVRGGGPISEY